ncbi:uncharacterized protein LAJ45_03899 [Morchella importuna]|uniref:uncharacterized protein n=1 Tax=Morchella importuna TaxID=1174673 RepID=UPI001E8CB8C9|nr:uncharacterized protein LAJ45_03899 [Morchella importuna]KAH8151906.1 hypothetical protein LAJ45_03899 [Morchella importuna]
MLLVGSGPDGGLEACLEEGEPAIEDGRAEDEEPDAKEGGGRGGKEVREEEGVVGKVVVKVVMDMDMDMEVDVAMDIVVEVEVAMFMAVVVAVAMTIDIDMSISILVKWDEVSGMR